MASSRQAWKVLLILQVALYLAACSPFFGQENPLEVGGGPSASKVAIAAVDVDFNPNRVVIPANRDVKIQLTNEGDIRHNFVVDALGIHVDLPAGQTRTINLRAPAGSYTYYCDKFGHRTLGMKGKLQAKE